MKKYILFFFLPVLLIGLHACDEGRIYENAVVATGEGRTVKMTGRISGVDKWSGDYSVVVAGFDDESTLGEQRVERTRLAAQKADLAIIVFSAYRSSESYRKAKAAIQWDCSVTCTEESTSAKYVITYSDVKVLSKTGTLTIQNKNDFDIVVHLLCEGEQEVVSDNIPANSFYSFTNVTDKEYTVGIHADVGVAADIRVVVYDGKDTEPYTK